MPHHKTTAGHLGARWSDLTAGCPTGTDLISSALVAGDDPFRELDHAHGLASFFRSAYPGTSEPLSPAP